MLIVLSEFGFSSLKFSKEDFLQENIINQIGYPPLRIDILTSIDGVTFTEAFEHKKVIHIESLEVSFIGLVQLIQNKKVTNSPQDMADIASLKKMDQYSLAIMPGAPIAEMVKDLKLLLRAEIGKSYGSANADAHISLDGFEADDDNYPYILAEYRRIVSGMTPFTIAFSGFGDFDKGNYSAFYVRPTDESSTSIRERTEEVMKSFDKKLKKQFIRKWADESKNPHMSIGRRLTREWVALAYSLFPGFEESFLCDAFVIRKFNEKRRQYEVVDMLPLKGNSAPPVQLDLFQP